MAVDITGKQYGKLTVLNRAEGDGKSRKIRWLCECECGNKIIVYGSDLKNKKVHSCGCVSEDEFDTVTHMTMQELEEYNKLYKYVRENVMHYKKNVPLSRYMALRLKGLKYGKYIERKDKENTADYSYKVILNTFKYCSFDIQRAISRNHFKTDEHKFRYILAIVERNLSTIHNRMKHMERSNEEMKSMRITPINENAQEQFKKYQEKIQNKSTVKMREKFKNIW